jgi:hypothetical protein
LRCAAGDSYVDRGTFYAAHQDRVVQYGYSGSLTWLLRAEQVTDLTNFDIDYSTPGAEVVVAFYGVMGNTTSCACSDVPTAWYSCAQQLGWGKCTAPWLVSGNYCQQTCGYCSVC